MSFPGADAPLAVEMRGVSKRFGSVQALHEVSLQVRAGATHAVVGENGAGKTTLMKALYGSLRPDEGQIAVEGREVRFGSAAEGIAAGIGMVSQHYSIIPELTCLQNLMLGAEPGLVLDRRQAANRAQELAESMGFSFDWHEEASHLSPAGAQKLEILKLLWRNARIMILDEPTAMLSPADSDALFTSLRKLAREGATILLVTHRLPEVLEHCETVTVLRGGRLVAQKPVAQTNASELAELIVGHAVDAPPELGAAELKSAVLRAEDLWARGRRGDEALRGISFEVRQGEVLGIAGVDGSGQRELFWALTGALPLLRGTLEWEGWDATRASPRQRIERGLRLIPEDRHEEGVVEEWPLEANAALGLQRLPVFSKRGWMDLASRKRQAARMAEKFQTRHGGLELPMASLSGGNQQRFVAARALEVKPRLVLAFQPARGLDIQATRQVYAALREACRQGAAAIVVSFDLDEILENCDRVAVLCAGRMAEPPPGKERDRAAIGRLMVGAQ
jgi:general nucleoside transport system ATP-binding protein